MKTARLISISAGVFYLFLFTTFLLTFSKLDQLYSSLEISRSAIVPAYTGLAMTLALTVLNLGFAFFVQNKISKGQSIKNSEIISIVIGYLPITFIIFFLVFSIILPIYSVSSAF